MAKVAIKYDNIVPYGEFFYVMNEFNIPNEEGGFMEEFEGRSQEPEVSDIVDEARYSNP